LAQVEKIEEYITARRKNAKRYNDLLKDMPNITTPPEMEWAKNVYWLYSILVENFPRDKLTSILREKEIDTRPFFHPMHTQPPYQKFGNEKLVVAEDLAKRGLSLPSAPTLTEDQLDYICGTITEILS
jgi:perosamine synthetase